MMAVVERLAVVAGGVVAVAIEVVAFVVAAARITGEFLPTVVGPPEALGGFVIGCAVGLLAWAGVRSRVD